MTHGVVVMNNDAYLEALFSQEAKRMVAKIATLDDSTPLSGWSKLDKLLRDEGYHAPTYLGSVNASSKIIKGTVYHVNTFIMYMAPAKFSGYGNVCPAATKGCEASCLNMSGRANFDKGIVRARVLRTWIWYGFRDLFNKRLIHEISSAYRRSQKSGYQFAVRLNGTSDISPLLFRNQNGCVLDLFPDDVVFYDYTKVKSRFKLLDKYSNYHLTYSWHDGASWDDIKDIDAGIAVPFYDWDDKKQRIKHSRYATIPTIYQDTKVFDGDTTDLRYMDRKLGAPKRGKYIVGLRAKRTNRRDEQIAIDTGFFQPI